MTGGGAALALLLAVLATVVAPADEGPPVPASPPVTAESIVDARWMLPKRMALRIEDEERDVLTEFLIGSDFFQQYPYGARTITYNGWRTACKSPFATFDL